MVIFYVLEFCACGKQCQKSEGTRMIILKYKETGKGSKVKEVTRNGEKLVRWRETQRAEEIKQ